MVGLFVPLAALELGASPAVVGLLVSAAFVLPLILAMPTGSLVDRIGSRRLLISASLTSAVVPVLVSQFLSLPTLFVAQVFFGMSHLVYIISAQRYVSGLGSGAEGERNFGWFSTFQSGAQMVGALLGGLLLDGFGVNWAFGLTGLLPLIAVAVVIALQDAAPAKVPIKQLRPFGERGEMRRLFANYGVRMAIVVSCSVLVVSAVRQTFLPVYLDALAFPATAIGFLISVRGFASMFVRPFMPAIVRLLRGRSWTLLATVIVLGVGIGVTPFVETIAPLVLASVLVGAGSGISQPLSVITVADHVPPEKVGFALGFRLTGNRLAQVFAPVLVGLVAELAGVGWSFIVAALVIFAMAPLIIMWRRGFELAERRVAEAGVAD